MALSWQALRQLVGEKLTPADSSDRIYSVEHRDLENALIDKMEELESSSKSGLYTIGAVKAFVTTNVPALATAPAFEGIVAGDAVGFVGQNNKVENGAYIYTGSGYRRATTADGFNPVVQGGLLTSGTAAYVIRNRGSILPGTTPQQWDSFYVNSGRPTVSRPRINIQANGQASFEIPDSILKGGEIMDIWFKMADFSDIMDRTWSFKDGILKLSADDAIRCKVGNKLMIEVWTWGTAGAGYGLDFVINGQKLYWKYDNSPTLKEAGDVNIIAGSTIIRLLINEPVSDGALISHNLNTDKLTVTVKLANGTIEPFVTAEAISTNQIKINVPHKEVFKGSLLLSTLIED